MRGIGTIINVAAVILGGGAGMLLKGGLKERYQQILMQALGVCTIFIGISGALKGMYRIENGVLETSGTMLLIASLVLGSLLGEWIQIENGWTISESGSGKKRAGKMTASLWKALYPHPWSSVSEQWLSWVPGRRYAGRLFHACRKSCPGWYYRPRIRLLLWKRSRLFRSPRRIMAGQHHPLCPFPGTCPYRPDHIRPFLCGKCPYLLRRNQSCLREEIPGGKYAARTAFYRNTGCCVRPVLITADLA